MLCKPKREEPKRLRIASTTYPEDRMTPIQAEQHCWIEAKKKVRPNCQFDSVTRTCACGINSIDEFALKCNNTK
jgi:hypothetical protein